ncbi:MAG: DUF4865 family protein [Nakamurella sp.]
MTTAPAAWLLQYPIVLPLDYDMEVIRHRVRTRGAALDGRSGLDFKAYAIRVAGERGSSVNEYAPFYSWRAADAAALFLAGGAGFQGIVADFGRPGVLTWLPLASAVGSLPTAEVVAARRWTFPLLPHSDPTAAAQQTVEFVASLQGEPGIHRAAAGIDPRSWEIVLYATTDGSAVAQGAPGDLIEYDVLHVSEG